MDDLSTVVLVEDNPDDAELIRHAFIKAGVTNPLVTVDDGDKALDYLHGRSIYADRAAFPLPGLFLLDLKLPRRSGFEVLQSIRAHFPTRNIPVVVFTSSNQVKDIERAYELGANSYLVKPVGRDTLITMIRSLDAFWFKMNKVPNHE